MLLVCIVGAGICPDTAAVNPSISWIGQPGHTCPRKHMHVNSLPLCGGFCRWAHYIIGTKRCRLELPLVRSPVVLGPRAPVTTARRIEGSARLTRYSHSPAVKKSSIVYISGSAERMTAGLWATPAPPPALAPLLSPKAVLGRRRRMLADSASTVGSDIAFGAEKQQFRGARCVVSAAGSDEGNTRVHFGQP